MITQFALPMLTLENARPLLKNPDRGLRMESYITLGVPESYPGNTEDPYEKMLGFIKKYEPESPTIVQLYVYLRRYNKKPLDEKAFAQLGRMLELLREHNVRALLRFAYQNEQFPGPNYRRIRGHLNQIEQWLRANEQLFDDSICCVQAGIVGLWGEGHNDAKLKKRHFGRIFDHVFRIVPEDMFVQVRTMELSQTIDKRYAPRLAMHDDYIIGEPYGGWSWFSGHKEPSYEPGFARTINDAELPWGHATYYDREDGHPLDSMDAIPIIKQLLQYSMTTFSLEHNYREKGPEHIFSMARWRDVLFTPAQLDELGFPYLPNLFDEDDTISAFEYIQYHLGYLLSATEFELDEDHRQVRFTIQNNGFAAPLNFNALSMVVDGKEVPVDSYDKFALGSMRAVTFMVDLPEGYDASQRVGIKLARRTGSELTVRFANDTAFEQGTQYFFAAQRDE